MGKWCEFLSDIFNLNSHCAFVARFEQCSDGEELGERRGGRVWKYRDKKLVQCRQGMFFVQFSHSTHPAQPDGTVFDNRSG